MIRAAYDTPLTYSWAVSPGKVEKVVGGTAILDLTLKHQEGTAGKVEVVGL